MTALAPVIRSVRESERLLAILILIAVLVYLVPFVSRGWVPHDEGMLGQSAERVLAGELPHIDYEEPYTGALTFLYAALFGAAGIDLLYVRWLLYACATLSVCLVYTILRRFLAPLAAAFGSVVALVWSFPNYFAGLPSWWVLACALLSVWALFRYVESGRWRFVVVAGLSAGIAIVIKQTGLYVLVAVLASLWMAGAPSSSELRLDGRLEHWLRRGFAVCSVGMALLVLRSRLQAADIIYLLSPIVAVAYALARGAGGSETPARVRMMSLMIATVAGFLPIAVLLLGYAIVGNVGQALHGMFILPQRRFAFASMDMPPAALVIVGMVMARLMLSVPRASARLNRGLDLAMKWGLALGLPIFALWNPIGYQMLWQSARALGVLTPLAAAWMLTRRSIDPERGALLFITSTMVAWASLVQFPFSAPIYYCYVTPLVAISGIAVADAAGWLRRPGLLAWTVMLLVFGLFSMNRSNLYALGSAHVVDASTTNLELPRASLRVNEHDARTYRRVVALLEEHLGEGALAAGPDCPEVYFLVRRFNPTGSLFDFFSDQAGDSGALKRWSVADAIVINHDPKFSTNLSENVVAGIRREFGKGERVDRFEVRWR